VEANSVASWQGPAAVAACARHVPAAIHGFASLGILILKDASPCTRRVQVDMGQ
jgi:hypothetical protein